MSADTLIIVLVTAPDAATADLLAETLVGARLAACVTVLPGIRSTYRWEGNIEKAEELLLLVKTTRGKFSELDAAIRKAHPFDTPEIVALAADSVTEKYLNWVRAEVKG